MNTILLNMLHALFAKVLSNLAGLNMNQVRDECLTFWNAGLTGEEKRKAVYRKLRELSQDGATWLLYAAIELAVGQIQQGQSK